MFIWLLLFYIVLTAVYFYKIPPQSIPKWSSIQAPEEIIDLSYQPCQTSKDCSSQYVCFQNHCIPKERLSGECNPFTGNWSIIEKNQKKYVTCVCKYPHIVTQKYSGGNCDTDVACPPKGHLKRFDVDPLQEGECECPTGYRSVQDPLHRGPSCKKMTIQEKFQHIPKACREDEVSDLDIFSKRYIQLGNQTGHMCLKLPCSFDALNHKRLRHTQFVKGKGCICDPKYGNVGVRINHDEYLENVPGYNACINIFKDEPDQPLKDVELYAYFYMLDRSPVSFIRFQNLDPDMLKSFFKKNGMLTTTTTTTTLQIEETYPYDYMQTVFKKNAFDARTRSCRTLPLLPMFIGTCLENEITPHPMVNCRFITRHTEGLGTTLSIHSHVNLYNILYQFPACQFDENDSGVSEMYRGHYVLNPFHLTFTGPQRVLRTNGLVMKAQENGEWFLDFASGYHFETYRGQIKHVPILEDRISQAVAKERLGLA